MGFTIFFLFSIVCMFVCLFFLKKDAEVLSKIPKGWIPCFFILNYKVKLSTRFINGKYRLAYFQYLRGLFNNCMKALR